ncbi:MAG TPA: hypothetical protein VG245_08370 [Candidatus Dormibacteraeota bacterium]|nr:hypothetical protein [Candidatus Dormibacteraeota bacterium]
MTVRGEVTATRRGERSATALRFGRVVPAALRRPGSLALLALAVYTALTLGLFNVAWAHPGRTWIGVGGDPNLVSWFLAWVPYAISHGHNPLLSDALNYPAGVNLMWNTSMPLAAVLLWPVTALGGPVLAYNVLLTASVALSAWTAFIAIRWLTGSAPGAFLGGLLYGFSPYMLTQSLAHVHVVAVFLAPLLLMLLADLLVRRRWPPLRTGMLLGACCAAQLLIGEEVLVGAALASGVGAAVLALMRRREALPALRRALPGLLLGLGVMAVIVAVPVAVQFLGPHRIHGPIQTRGVYVSDLLNFVVPTQTQYFAPQAALVEAGNFSGNGTEWNAYLGAPLLLLLLGGVIALRRNALAVWAGASGLVMAVLSLGPHLRIGGRDTGLRLPELVIDRLPVLANVLPNRLALFVDMFAAILLAVVVARLLAAARPIRWAGLAAVAVAALPLLPSLPFPALAAGVPAYFQGPVRADVAEGSVVVIAPFADFTDADAMGWQAAAGIWFKSPAGYLVNDNPDGTPRFSVRPTPLSKAMLQISLGDGPPVLDGATRSEILNQLRDLAAREVVVGTMAHEDQMVAFWEDLLGRAPDRQTGGVYLWRPAGPRPAG